MINRTMYVIDQAELILFIMLKKKRLKCSILYIITIVLELLSFNTKSLGILLAE